MAFIEVEGECKRYRSGEGAVVANDHVTFEVERGELAVVLGPSGAGKSTLLNVLGGMDSCDEGRVRVGGRDLAGRSARELTRYRREDVGFVFQFYNLVPDLTAFENVELGSEIAPDALDTRAVLDLVGLSDRMDNYPAQLSGGEQQRVAIARTVAKNPKVLLCDEPTGALDYRTGKQILQLLQDMARAHGATSVIVTHNSALAAIADRVIRMRDGRVTGVERNASPRAIAEIEW